MEQLSADRAARWPVYLALILLVFTLLVLGVAWINVTGFQMTAQTRATTEPTGDTYASEVEDLLRLADPQRGAILTEQFGCNACHRLGAVNHIAPAFDGIAQRAAARRPPLTATAYLYESITNPSAFVVENYAPVMPQDFRARLSDHQLGDIIAYLMTVGAR